MVKKILTFCITLTLIITLSFTSAQGFIPLPSSTFNTWTGNLTNLSEMQDIFISSPTNGQLLIYDSSGGLWTQRDSTYFSLTSFNNNLGIGNWSADKGDYYTSAQTDTAISNGNTTLYNWVTGQNFLLTSEWNATNTSYLTTANWNSTNTSYVPYTGSNANVVLGDFNFSVGTSDFFVNSNTGNVGIGTTNPLVKFQTNTGTNENLGILTNSGPIKLAAFNDAGDTNIQLNYDALIHAFQISGSEKMRVNSDGNVGIGTTAPNYPLQVNGSVSGISIYAQYNISADDYLYHSPFPMDTYTNNQALMDLLKIRGNNGKLNHSTIPSNAMTILEKPIYETETKQVEKVREVCSDNLDIKTNETTQICNNETYFENETTQKQIGTEQEPQTSVGMMLGNVIKSIQKLFDWNTEQDTRIAKMEATLCSDGHMEYCIISK